MGEAGRDWVRFERVGSGRGGAGLMCLVVTIDTNIYQVIGRYLPQLAATRWGCSSAVWRGGSWRVGDSLEVGEDW